jgi:hypothetical protein
LLELSQRSEDVMDNCRALYVVFAVVGSALLSLPSNAQEQEKQELKKQDTVPKSGSAAGAGKSDQNAKEEPSSKILGIDPTIAILVNGALTVAGAPTDGATIPSKYSVQNAADDKLPIAAYTFRHLTDEQRKSVREALGGVPSGSSLAIGGYAQIGAQVPTTVALEKLQAVPAVVLAQLPEMRGIAFTLSEGKVLLVNAKSQVVVAVLD